MRGSFYSSPNPAGQKLRDIDQAIAGESGIDAALAKRHDRAYVQSELTPKESGDLDTRHGVLGIGAGDNTGEPSQADVFAQEFGNAQEGLQ